MAGVGVNLFLFLSGYGLTTSALKEKLPVLKFYQKRLLKLFTPFWVVISIFFLLDFLVLRLTYSWPYIFQSLIGYFPRADLFLDINSPFWFLTPILFYYLLFPFIFFKQRSWLSAIFVYLASYLILQFKLPVTSDILRLYQLHILAFPLGMAFASLFFEPFYFNRFAPAKIKAYLYNLKSPVWLKMLIDKFKAPNIFHRILKIINRPAYFAIIIALLIFIGYLAYYSGVGQTPDKEQTISLVTMGAIILFFILKKMDFKLFYLFGFYAYEIYLIHWPLMSRYDQFFKRYPGWLAMVLYFCLFIFLAWALKKFIKLFHLIKKLK